jgi:peptidoglycan hydrolase-like protein with peptidoglycan-binding domain
MSNVLDFTRALSAYEARKTADALFADNTAEAVLAAQKHLVRLGFKLKGGADGLWGSSTAGALYAFKKAYGLNTGDAVITQDVLDALANTSPGDIADAVKAWNAENSANLTSGAATPKPPATVTALATRPPATAKPPGASLAQKLFPAAQPFYKKPGVWMITLIALIAIAGIASSRRAPSATQPGV